MEAVQSLLGLAEFGVAASPPPPPPPRPVWSHGWQEAAGALCKTVQAADLTSGCLHMPSESREGGVPCWAAGRGGRWRAAAGGQGGSRGKDGVRGLFKPPS